MRLSISALLLLTSSAVSATPPLPSAAWEAYAEYAQVHTDAFMERIRTSQHPDDLAIALLSFPVPIDPADFAEVGRRWALAGPNAATVTLVAGWSCTRNPGTAPRTLCDQHQLMTRWQRADPKNASVWLLAAAAADAEGDPARFELYSTWLMASDHIDSGFTDSLRLLRERMAADGEYAQQPRGDRALVALGIALALVPSYGNGLELCPRGRNEPIRIDRMELCRHLSALMLKSSEQMTAMIGNVIAAAYALDDAERARLAEDKNMRTALMTEYVADPRLSAEPSAEGFPDYFDDYLQLVIEHGEREAMIRWLASAEPADDAPRPHNNPPHQ